MAQVNSNKIKMFDFFGTGELQSGARKDLRNYALLKNDPIGDFPSSFTICSSIYLARLISGNSYFQLLNNKGEPWMVLNDLSLEADMIHTSQINVNGVWKQGFKEYQPFLIAEWDNICLGINTEIGEVTIVRQGNLEVDSVMSEFKNRTFDRPQSLANSLMLGGAFYNNGWYCCTNLAGNVNVYASKLEIDEMKSITSGVRCGEEGNYLAWSNSEWIIQGNDTKIVEIEKSSICKEDNVKRYIHGLQTPEELMTTCEKLGKSKLHLPKDLKHSQTVINEFKDLVLYTENGTYKAYPGECNSYFVAGFDSFDEREWIDMYTKEPIQYFEWIPGQPNAKLQRCITQQPIYGHGPGITWFDTFCDVKSCGVCERNGPFNLQLRGLCQGLSILKPLKCP